MARRTAITPIGIRAVGVSELAEAWGVSGRHIYRLIDDGRLPAFKVGERILVRLADVEAFESSTAYHGKAAQA